MILDQHLPSLSPHRACQARQTLQSVLEAKQGSTVATQRFSTYGPEAAVRNGVARKSYFFIASVQDR